MAAPSGRLDTLVSHSTLPVARLSASISPAATVPFGAPSPSTELSGSGARTVYVVAETILLAVAFVVYARLSADVLRTILPGLPRRSWIASLRSR